MCKLKLACIVFHIHMRSKGELRHVRPVVRFPTLSDEARLVRQPAIACCCCCRVPPSLPWGFLMNWGDVVFVTLHIPNVY
jgi:hypothetical protein